MKRSITNTKNGAVLIHQMDMVPPETAKQESIISSTQ
jgi:hypothetical protein